MNFGDFSAGFWFGVVIFIGIAIKAVKSVSSQSKRWEHRYLEIRIKHIRSQSQLYLEDPEDYERYFSSAPIDTWDLVTDRFISSGLLWTKPRILLGEMAEPDPERLATLRTLLISTERRQLKPNEVANRAIIREG